MARMVILTGAGISAESGLPTFRDPKGLWARFDPMDLATPEAFERDPAQVQAFYNDRRAAARAAQPNPAHLALAQLQRARPGEVLLVTQNVDDLHERAGSTDVVHVHGRLDEARCNSCAHRWPAPARMAAGDRCPACRSGLARPSVVWFGEVPEHLDEVAEACARCDLLVVIGSSGTVWPVAGLVDIAARAGAQTIEINLDPSVRAGAFDRVLAGPASVRVSEWVAQVLDGPFNL